MMHQDILNKGHEITETIDWYANRFSLFQCFSNDATWLAGLVR